MLNVFNTKNTKKIVACIIVIEAIFFIAPKLFTDFQPATILVGILNNLTNKERRAENIPELTVNPVLSTAAELKVNDMIKNNYFAHTSRDGLTPWHWLDLVGYKYDYAGENLAVNFTETADITAAWMKSPTHRTNIEKSQYTEMGSAIATGTYKGREAVFVVQIYANPRILELENIVANTSPQVTETATSEVIFQSGEILGTTTEKVPMLHAENLAATLIPEDNSSMNNILLIALFICIALFVISFIVRFALKHIVMNVLIIAIVLIVISLININFLKINIFSGGVDYSANQTVN